MTPERKFAATTWLTRGEYLLFKEWAQSVGTDTHELLRKILLKEMRTKRADINALNQLSAETVKAQMEFDDAQKNYHDAQEKLAAMQKMFEEES